MRTTFPLTAIAVAFSLACAPRPGDPGPPPAGGAPDAGLADGAPDAGLADGGAAGAPAVPDGGALPLLSAEALLPDGGATPLSRDGPSLVDPAAGFRIAVGAELLDARLSVLDGADAAVPSTGAMEIGAVSRFSLSPSGPLRPGSTYLLRLDGATSRDIHGARGEIFAPLVLQIRTSGEPPPPPRHRSTRRVRTRR